MGIKCWLKKKLCPCLKQDKDDDPAYGQVDELHDEELSVVNSDELLVREEEPSKVVNSDELPVRDDKPSVDHDELRDDEPSLDHDKELRDDELSVNHDYFLYN